MPLTKDELKTILSGEEDLDQKLSAILEKVNGEIATAQDIEARKERERAEGLQGKLTDARKELRELQKTAANSGELEEAIKKSQETIETLQKELEASKVQGAIDLAVARSGLRNSKTAELVKKCIDMGQIKVEKDGTVTGVEEQLEGLKADEETSYLFEPAKTPAPEYKPVKGDGQVEESLGKKFAREFVEASSPGLNATFDSAVI